MADEIYFFNCFTSETLVATETGQKRINEIEVGDLVWSANVETGEVELKEVTEVFVKEDNICVQDLEQAGFKIDYDADTKVPSISNKTKELDIYVDDEEKTVESILLSGRNYVQMRELADAVGNFNVDYKDSKVYIKTDK